ncbi:hypothetical protein SAMN02982919_00759 [Giesbergeria anulus]|uniref:Uncharacterized protein n=1 Tax=Giesbergeria anulus TaxID=180197 RepID=A0A1H9GAB5_9BURK|nr:hypothetical protein SAMN02982919_00759 [Giesbergeria anulus]
MQRTAHIPGTAAHDTPAVLHYKHGPMNWGKVPSLTYSWLGVMP